MVRFENIFKKKAEPKGDLLVEKWRERYFPANGDAAWKDWVNTFKPNFRSLVDLLTDSSMGTTFKARALIVILSPSEEDTVIYWRRDDRITSTGSSMLSLFDINLEDSVPAEFIVSGFVSDLVVRACQNVPDDEWGKDMLSNCNSYIRQLLALLPTEQAQLVWPFFLINDPKVYWTMETCSGYNPWHSLMRNPNISECWKALADECMREIIDAELAGHRKAREEHEDALRCYVSHLDLMWHYNRAEVYYSTDLLASQLKYLLSQDSNRLGKALAYREGLLYFLPRLAGDQQQALRTQIIRFSLFGSEHPFRIRNADDLRLAEQLQTYLDPADEREHRALEELIAGARPKVEADQRKLQQEEDRREAILQRMQG